ncbi:MAG: hypothetical protein HRU18_06750 [Pseudoalteromonas sp.]|uniref:hypothetical protein n=1 Tax=Pseudoalteromonas sp. TaxID=53249 RepID=UPI001DC46D0B|nr:hypothetical protein [Pseudoalteromonas sp.]NRA77889.1 hypothetical protein [Pseudoalteromonas sp.]
MAVRINVKGSNKSFLYQGNPRGDDTQFQDAYSRHVQAIRIGETLQGSISGDFGSTIEALADQSATPMGLSYTDNRTHTVNNSPYAAGDAIRGAATFKRFRPVMTGMAMAGPAGAVLGGVAAWFSDSTEYDNSMDLADTVGRIYSDDFKHDSMEGLSAWGDLENSSDSYSPVKGIMGGIMGGLSGVFGGIMDHTASREVDTALSDYQTKANESWKGLDFSNARDNNSGRDDNSGRNDAGDSTGANTRQMGR